LATLPPLRAFGKADEARAIAGKGRSIEAAASGRAHDAPAMSKSVTDALVSRHEAAANLGTAVEVITRVLRRHSSRRCLRRLRSASAAVRSRPNRTARRSSRHIHPSLPIAVRALGHGRARSNRLSASAWCRSASVSGLWFTGTLPRGC